MSTVRLHYRVVATDALGPFLRYVLWTQGCLRRCEGCTAPDTHDMAGGCAVACFALAREVLSQPGIEGITISGGEPFLQAEALRETLAYIHAEKPLGVILYTGYLYEDLATVEGAEGLLAHVDTVIDGAYITAQNDNGALRGSANQRAIHRTQRYAAFFAAEYGKPGSRRQQVSVEPWGLWVTGIPPKAEAPAT